jgi:hypothetical protein
METLRRTVAEIHLPGRPIEMKKTIVERRGSVDEKRVRRSRKRGENELLEGLRTGDRNEGMVRSTRRMREEAEREVGGVRTSRKERGPRGVKSVRD